MKITDNLKKRRSIAPVVAVIALLSVVSISMTQVSATETKTAQHKNSRVAELPWSTRTYSPDPPLTPSCAKPNLNVLILVDRNQGVVDADRRDIDALPTDSSGTKLTTQWSIQNGLANTWVITSDMFRNAGGTVNFYTYAFATNVVAQFKGTDTDGDGIVDKPAINTQDTNGDGIADAVPDTQITDPDVKLQEYDAANMYMKGTGDPDSASNNPTDLERGYGTTTSPQGTGQDNWANALSFATNMVSTRAHDNDPNNNIDIVYIMAAANPDQNNGYNQVANVLGDHDLGIYDAATAFNAGGLNNTSPYNYVPKNDTERSMIYKDSRDSDIWQAANDVEALRSGNPVAQLSNDPSGSSTRPGLSESRNPVLVQAVLGGRFPSYTPGNEVFGDSSRYLAVPDFRKSYTGNAEGGWLDAICKNPPQQEPKTVQKDVSVSVSGLPSFAMEGQVPPPTATITITNKTPSMYNTSVTAALSGCSNASTITHVFTPGDLETWQFICQVADPMGAPSSHRVEVKILQDSDISVTLPTGYTALPNSGTMDAYQDMSVGRVAMPS